MGHSASDMIGEGNTAGHVMIFLTLVFYIKELTMMLLQRVIENKQECRSLAETYNYEPHIGRIISRIANTFSAPKYVLRFYNHRAANSMEDCSVCASDVHSIPVGIQIRIPTLWAYYWPFSIHAAQLCAVLSSAAHLLLRSEC